jgi:hypothetical protein
MTPMSNLSKPFDKFDYSSAAREVMGQATRAGVTGESIGQWMNLAWRCDARGKHADAARYARKAIEIHETWGLLHATYTMAEGTLERARRIAAQSED